MSATYVPCSGLSSNNSFKPNLLRYTNNMAGKACHVVGYATQVGLTQVLGRALVSGVAGSGWANMHLSRLSFGRPMRRI